MSLLRELAAMLIEAAQYLEKGTAWDKAWSKHLAMDARDMEQLAQVDRHVGAERTVSKP